MADQLVPKPTNDAIARFCRGDDDAFREIVVEWHVRLQARLAGAGIPIEDVPLVAQDVFLHVYDNVNDFQVGTNFRAWLYSIARNKVRAYHEATRRLTRNKANALEYFLQQKISESPNLDDRIDLLNQCLAKLSSPVRDLVKKRYAGMSIKDLSKATERSESSIKMTLLRARESLRNCIVGAS
jgi:RNA polymerase sigma-70 factor (ECF subfamily)